MLFQYVCNFHNTTIPGKKAILAARCLLLAYMLLRVMLIYVRREKFPQHLYGDYGPGENPRTHHNSTTVIRGIIPTKLGDIIYCLLYLPGHLNNVSGR